MNGASVLLAKYTRDLLQQPEQTVVILGRRNVPRGDASDLQIVIDQLAPATPITDTQSYDGEAEIMTVTQLWRSVMTVDFYGDEGYDQAIKFITLNRHQTGLELKQALGIDLHNVGQLQDLKLLQGEQYSERYQIEVTMIYNISNDISTLRIDTAQFDELLTN